MTHTIVWTNSATAAYRELRSHDRPGAATVGDAVRALASDPRPPTSRRLGTTDFYRLRVGPFRILYRVDDDASAVVVEHVGRAAGDRAE